MSESEVETSQGNKTIIDTLSNFENASLVREGETAFASGSRNEDKIQVWTQSITEKTNNKKVSDLRKEINEKLEKMLKEMKNSRTAQSVQIRRYQEQNTSQVGTSKITNNRDDETNASEPEDQENAIQDNPFRPSNMKELRTPMQPLKIQNIDFIDSVVINEDRTGEDCHMDISVFVLGWPAFLSL